MTVRGSWLVAVAGWAVAVIIGVLIAAAVVDGSGRQDNNHAGPVPAGVAQLDDVSYMIINPKDGPSPEMICGLGVKTIRSVEALGNAQFVMCREPQTWNDTRPASPNFSEAAVTVLTSRWLHIPAGALFLALMLIPARTWRAEREYNRRWKARQQRILERYRVEAEQVRRELIAAFVREDNPISREELERGLRRVSLLSLLSTPPAAASNARQSPVRWIRSRLSDWR